MNAVAEDLLGWWDRHGRKDLPWQLGKTAYRVWLSEIMLQQTQVATVIPYFERFIARFPSVETLAEASSDSVLAQWTGLGYYNRARNLHATARRVVAEFGGEFPADQETLESLPGIGRSTAAAIVASVLDQRGVILDGNVKRVLARLFTVDGHASQSATQKQLWALADEHTPSKRCADYNQAIMDLGATVCRRSKPACESCPLAGHCKALAASRVSDYPMPKPKKMKPVREAAMFVVRTRDGATLLEQRGEQGVWAGLWNPPERSIDTSPSQFAQAIGLSADLDWVTGEPFRHTFSHYHLDLLPHFVELNAIPAAIADDRGSTWYRSGDNEELGLSAVAVKLLAEPNPVQVSLI